MKWGHTLDEKEKEFIERQIQLALSGCPEYEVPGDEDTDPQGPLLEKYPHQQLLKLYLIRHGHLEFRKRRFLKDKAFNVLGARGNIAWCCDPDCDKVIVDMPISLFINHGTDGEIVQHQECFEKNLRAGYYSLSGLPEHCP